MTDLRAALTSEDEIAHGQAVVERDGQMYALGACAYCDDEWPCRTQRGIDRLLALIPEGGVLVTEERLARALEQFRDKRTDHYLPPLFDDRDGYGAHLGDSNQFAAAILRHLRETP